MLTLGLDTTTAWGSVGLYNLQPLGEISARRHARKNDPLMPSVEQLLAHAGVQQSNIELVAVALGPGSFTGLRVGLSLAKGLSMGLGVPVVGVPSLPMLAKRVAWWPDLVCAMVADRKDRAYVAWFQQGAECKGADAVSLAQLQKDINDALQPVLLIGPGLEIVREQLQLNQNISLASNHIGQPSGLDVARLGFKKFKRNGTDDAATLEPIYCAPPAIDPGGVAITR